MNATASSTKTPVKCNVILGAKTKDIPQYGKLGLTMDDRARIVGLDLNQTMVACLFGMQGVGKSYALGDIIEMYSNKIPHINELPKAGCSIIFHYSQSASYKPEWTSMANPNTNKEELESLNRDYPNVEPRGAEKILVLVPPSLLEERRKEFSNLQVEPILFNPDEINVESWINLIGSKDVDSDEMLSLFSIMEDHRADLSPDVLMNAIDADDLIDDRTKKSLKLRIKRAARYIHDDARMSQWFKPGYTVIVDMRDEFLFKNTAFRLMLCALQVIQGVVDDDGNIFPKLVCFDEAHEYASDPYLVEAFVRMVRIMRHIALTILFASQDPESMPKIIISLSGLLILLGLETEDWVTYIASAKSPVSRIVPEELTNLESGECYIWSRKSSDALFSKVPQRVKLRSRVTHHGGVTITAVDAV